MEISRTKAAGILQIAANLSAREAKKYIADHWPKKKMITFDEFNAVTKTIIQAAKK